MRITFIFIAPIALVLAVVIPQAPLQAQPYQGPTIQVPVPGFGAEHQGRARAPGAVRRA